MRGGGRRRPPHVEVEVQFAEAPAIVVDAEVLCGRGAPAQAQAQRLF